MAMQVILVACLLCVAPLIVRAADTSASIEVLSASLVSPPLQFRVRVQPGTNDSTGTAAASDRTDADWIAAAHARFTDSRAASTGWYGLTLIIADTRSPLVNDSVAIVPR